MLTHLKITNFAVVRELDVEFDRGLIAVTGETGAGKSIMVDAIGLILGDRADSGIIRTGTERAEISATFSIEAKSFAEKWLEEQAFDTDACILRRVLNRDGRSRAFINGTPVTLGQIKTLGEALIDVHSQHEHQSLLIKANHSGIFDSFAGASAARKSVAAKFQQWNSAQQALSAAREHKKNREERQELLLYQLDEFADLNLSEGEFEQLEIDQARLSDAENIREKSQQILNLLEARAPNTENSDCISGLVSAQRTLEHMGDNHPLLNDTSQLLSEALINSREAVSNVQHYLEQVEVNPGKLKTIEDRLSTCFDLARKHRIQPTDLLDQKRRLNEELKRLQDASTDMEDLAVQVEAYRKDFFAHADMLSDMRAAATDDFSTAISQHLQEMGMGGAMLIAELSPLADHEASASGVETIEFLVSTNSGQPPRPLNKIASGGELSRISLAIQVVSATDSKIPTLIFDEVDVGIGGATAEIVGALLRKLGSSGQVICVTHQAQVAAKAHHHLSVRKQASSQGTDSIIECLNPEQKTDEIARMLGGIKMTDQTLAHAKEMLTSQD